jgi:hypothetical protein
LCGRGEQKSFCVVLSNPVQALFVAEDSRFWPPNAMFFLFFAEFEQYYCRGRTEISLFRL